MTLGGRHRGSRPLPTAIPRRMSSAIAACFCSGSPVSGVAWGSSHSNTGGGGIQDKTAPSPDDPSADPAGVVCSADMAVSLTIGTLTLHGGATYGLARVDLGARMAGGAIPFGGAGYVFSLHSHGAGPSHDYELWTDYTAISPAYTGTAAGPAVAGDVFELITSGTSIVAKRNGSTIFSVTDSTVGDPFAGVPTSYASYHLTASATSDIAVSGFSVTPDC